MSRLRSSTTESGPHVGTDIHPAIEVRRKGVWRYHRPKTLCQRYAETWDDPVQLDIVNQRLSAKGYPTHKLGDRQNTWDRCKYRLPEFFYDRNYRVFALLGNVRNGSGFAGVYTHDEIPYIQDNRGRPDDITPEAEAKLSDEHSDGWVTLQELKDYDYDLTFTEGGVVSEPDYIKSMTTGQPPETWSGMVTGKDIVVLQPGEFAKLFVSPVELFQGLSAKRSPHYDPTKKYLVHHKWNRKLRGEVAVIPDQWIPYLEKLIPKGGTTDDVRVVFDFDS